MSREIRRDHRITLAAWAPGGRWPPLPLPLAPGCLVGGGRDQGVRILPLPPAARGIVVHHLHHRSITGFETTYFTGPLPDEPTGVPYINLYRVPCFCPLQVPRTPALSSCFLPLARACKGLHEGSEQT